MAAEKFQRGSEMFLMFSDYWNLAQSYWNPEDNDKYWEDYLLAADQFCQKYNKSKFSRGLVLSLTEELERRAKGSRKP